MRVKILATVFCLFLIINSIFFAQFAGATGAAKRDDDINSIDTLFIPRFYVNPEPSPF